MQFDQATLLWREAETGLLKQEWGKYFKGKILDLGCGEGEIAKEVFGKKIEWGLDCNREMAIKAKKSQAYQQVILGDARQIELKDRSVDLVFSNSVLEHIKEIDKVLKEVGRILKPGGRLIATMPSEALSQYLGGGIYAKLFNQKYHHYHLDGIEGWRQRLTRAGLKLVDSYYYLDREATRQWHKQLWLNKLGMKIKSKPALLKRLKFGAAIAIMAEKL